MKNLLLVTAVICSAALVAVRASPVPEPKTDIELMKIPLEGDKELDVITLVNSDDQKINERNKRTIGILRELFPTISQILDQKIQMITSYLFRTLGPILLRSGLGGGAAGGDSAGSRGSTDDDFDDDFDDDDDDKNISSDNGRKVSISLPTFPPSSDDDEKASSSTAESVTTSAENEIRKRSAALRSATTVSSASSVTTTASLTTTDSVAPSTTVISGSSSAEQTTTIRSSAQESTDSNLV